MFIVVLGLWGLGLDLYGGGGGERSRKRKRKKREEAVGRGESEREREVLRDFGGFLCKGSGEEWIASSERSGRWL